MGIPKPITFTSAGDGYDGPAPENFVIIGDVPGGDSGPVAFGDLTGVPAALTAAQAAGTASIRAIGTTATTAAAGNHTHTFTALTGSVAGASGANLQAILNDLQARLAAVEAV